MNGGSWPPKCSSGWSPVPSEAAIPAPSQQLQMGINSIIPPFPPPPPPLFSPNLHSHNALQLIPHASFLQTYAKHPHNMLFPKTGTSMCYTISASYHYIKHVCLLLHLTALIRNVYQTILIRYQVHLCTNTCTGMLVAPCCLLQLWVLLSTVLLLQ